MINDSEVMGMINYGDEEFPTHEYSIFDSGPTKCDTEIKTDQLYYKPSCSSFNFKPKNNPYLPIENEPMGRDYSPNNFNGWCNKSNYNYRPLSYKTPARSYFDDWIPFKNEHFTNQMGDSFYLMIFFFIIIIVFAYLQNQQINNLRETINQLISTRK